MAELIRMCFGALADLCGSREHVLHGHVHDPVGRGSSGVYGRLKSTVQYRILGVG